MEHGCIADRQCMESNSVVRDRKEAVETVEGASKLTGAAEGTHQPNHRIITPSTNREELCPAKSLACKQRNPDQF